MIDSLIFDRTNFLVNCFFIDELYNVKWNWFWIEKYDYCFGIKIDAIPGRINLASTLRSLFKGEHRGFCFELCGQGHSSMLIVGITFEQPFNSLLFLLQIDLIVKFILNLIINNLILYLLFFFINYSLDFTLLYFDWLFFTQWLLFILLFLVFDFECYLLFVSCFSFLVIYEWDCFH